MFVTFLLILSLVWSCSVLNCENLTNLHSGEFADCAQETISAWDMTGYKVLEYSEDHAKLYFYDKDDGNLVLAFEVIYEKNGESWVKKNDTNWWSKQGSADEISWPYNVVPPSGDGSAIPLLLIIGAVLIPI